MSELGFQVFARVYPAAEELLYAACLVLFFRPFMPERRRWGRLILIAAADLLVFLLCGSMTVPQGTFSLLLTALLTALSGALGLEKRAVFLLALLYWNAKNSSGLMVVSLDHIGSLLWIAPAHDPAAVYLRSTVLLTLLLLSHAALLAAMLYALQRRLRRRSLPLDRRELCCLSLMPMAGILFGQMTARLLFEMKDGILLQLYERHPAFLAAVPALAMLLYAGAYLTIAFQQGMAALREEQATHYMEYQQTRMIRARIREAEQFYTHIRRLKHEMRGHLANIKGLAQSGEYAGLEDYIARMDESMSGLELTLQTGNPVTDVIVNDTRRRSLDLGVRFRSDFHYPAQAAYDAFDVGIILQNLLQNALEACGKVSEDERFIVLTGKRRGRFFLIEVKNSFMGEVVFGQDGLPVTTKKEDLSMHGLGLSNVHREAEKYMGELELKTERQEFSATVLLQERSNDEHDDPRNGFRRGTVLCGGRCERTSSDPAERS